MWKRKWGRGGSDEKNERKRKQRIYKTNERRGRECKVTYRHRTEQRKKKIKKEKRKING